MDWIYDRNKVNSKIKLYVNLSFYDAMDFHRKNQWQKSFKEMKSPWMNKGIKHLPNGPNRFRSILRAQHIKTIKLKKSKRT